MINRRIYSINNTYYQYVTPRKPISRQSQSLKFNPSFSLSIEKGMEKPIKIVMVAIETQPIY